MTALRIAAGALVLLWWAPTILLMLAGYLWREARFTARLARARRLRRAGRLEAAKAALDRIRRDFTL